MKIGILGAGISGLSLAKMLNNFDVEILEQDKIYGGIARTKDINGTTYHTVGGHCFNSKFQDVLDFVFNEIMPENEWHKVTREAVINLGENEVPYPIEYSVKKIFEFDPELAYKITSDFLAAKDTAEYRNLEDWFRKKFGNTLADIYFIPYNKKIWNQHPSKMSPNWVEGKLPIPDKESFFRGLIDSETDKMPHSSFYYPKSNNQNTFIDKLAEGLNITLNYTVNNIEKTDNGKWRVNNDKEYDILVSTLPLNVLPLIISNVPSDIIEYTKKLRFNKVTTMLWETIGTDHTWTYVPDSNNLFHRYIHIGNFFNPKTNHSITEVVGERSYDEMVANGKQDSFLVKPLDYNVSNHAYVVFDENYANATSAIKAYLNTIGIETLGRFGEWQYYNMDVCIKSAINLFTRLKDNLY